MEHAWKLVENKTFCSLTLSLSLVRKVQDHNFRSAGRHTGEMAALRAHAQSGGGADDGLEGTHAQNVVWWKRFGAKRWV